MMKHSTGTEVRAWGLSQGREDVKDGRGRLASTLVEAYNSEHPRAKYLPASKAPEPTITVKVRPETGKGRSVPKRVSVAKARAWGKSNGHSVGARGTLSQEVLTAYAQTI